MAIIRTKKEGNFVQASKEWINDNRLSAKAKGIMIYLLSKPDNWTVRISDIVNHMKDGRDSISAGMKELQEHGYIVRTQVRDINGTFGEVIYDVYECPVVQMLDEQIQERSYGNQVADSVKTEDLPMPTVNGKSDNGDAETTNIGLVKNDLSNVVVEYPSAIKSSLDKHNLTVNAATLKRWLSLSNEETIVQVIEYAVSRQGIGSIVGYITSILQQGWVCPQKGQSRSVMQKNTKGHKQHAKKDKLPEWVVLQNQSPQNKADLELTDEQKQQAQELLMALGEV